MTKFILYTNYGDVWTFDNEEEAKRNKYIFGGTIKKVEEQENNAVEKVKAETAAGVLTRNEIREMFGYPPIEKKGGII